VIASGIEAKQVEKKTARASKVQNQTQARYTLSEPATVTLTVERKALGHKVAGKCQRLKKAAKPTGKPCPLWVRTGKALTRPGGAGANAQSFSAKSIRKRGLRPGPYRIVVVAADAAGNRSANAIARFAVAIPR
jgi:hypothetical protein